MNINDIKQIDFTKNPDGLLPVIIQDNNTLQVLMLGYMNQEAILKTLEYQKITFFSRSKNRLWTKGETSHNYLILNNIYLDCDNDSLLIMATPAGPTCHTNNNSCFNSQTLPALAHIGLLDEIIQQRILKPSEQSYTHKLINSGLTKIAQKVGEEAVEVVIAAIAQTKHDFLAEVTDLLYHLLVLLHAKELTLSDVATIIQQRQSLKTTVNS